MLGSWFSRTMCAGLVFSFVLLAGCVPSEKMSLGGVAPSILYTRALSKLSKGQNKEAEKILSFVVKVSPYSTIGKAAALKLFSLALKEKDYLSAVDIGRSYLDNHSNSPEAHHVQYRVASAYLKQAGNIFLDPQPLKTSKIEYLKLIENYPGSKHIATARLQLTAIDNRLAAKELELGRYYLMRRKYVAAINRLNQVILHYQKTRFFPEALARIAEAYVSLGITKEALSALKILKKEDPKGPWYPYVGSLLKTNLKTKKAKK